MDQIAGVQSALQCSQTETAAWWRGGVIYQIYPRSFQDSDGDGVGDLRGIIERLPYIQALNVDAVWISPFFRSPMADFGYDVSDYRDVDPLFGSLETFDELLAKAHELGIKVLIDLVLSHTAEDHEWFVESRSSKSNSKADWYVWADPNSDGTPPNNWLSVFGGCAWEWEGVRGQYYLHNFLISQPDLNFHNPEVQEAVLEVFRFWLERGVDGFRLDTVNFYFCDRQLRSNPPLPPEERRDDIAPSVNPYNFQRHLYDKNQPENLEFLRSLRRLLDSYDARMMIGEVGEAQRGLEIMGEYTHGDSLMHSCYAFDLLCGNSITAKRVFEVVSLFLCDAPDSWPTWSFSNHDVVRHTTRWGLSKAAQSTVLTLLMCLRGTACIFQGEELGLPEAELEHADIRDPYGVRFWPRFPGRDGCRTPMVWDSGLKNCGFSDVEPWLPIPDAHRTLSVSAQETDSDSLLRSYRRILALRRDWPVLRSGELQDLRAHGQVLSFRRVNQRTDFYCAFNLGTGVQTLDQPPGSWTPVSGFGEFDDENRIRIGDWSVFLAHNE